MAVAVLLVTLVACGSDSGKDTNAASTSDGGAASEDGTEAGTEFEGDVDMRPEDFVCVRDWPKVRAFHITNLLGYEAEALAVANSPDGGTYPPGTVIQLIPTEAMVKREAGWSPGTNDWEFFALQVDAQGTTIAARGKTEVVNAFNGNCFDCHAKAEPQWDLVCEDTHGCDPLFIDDEVIQALQDGDPRCP